MRDAVLSEALESKLAGIQAMEEAMVCVYVCVCVCVCKNRVASAMHGMRAEVSRRGSEDAVLS